MKRLLGILIVLACTNVSADEQNECVQTATAGKYVAEQRDNGTPELVTVFNARSRFAITNEMALNNLVFSVYDQPHVAPADVYAEILQQCNEVLLTF